MVVAQTPVAGFGDTLLSINLPAAPRRRHKPGIGSNLASIAEATIEAFKVEHGRDLRTDRLEPCEQSDRRCRASPRSG